VTVHSVFSTGWSTSRY